MPPGARRPHQRVVLDQELKSEYQRLLHERDKDRDDYNGHESVQRTQRYLNVTDEELRKGLEVSWKRRTLRAVAGGQNA